MKVVLAGQEFKSKDALRRTVAAILRSTPLNTELQGRDFELLLALLQHHPNAQQKIGVGVRSICVRTLVGSSSGFVVCRTDGTETDFSYTWCIKCLGNPAPHDDAFERAFRTAVIDQKNATLDFAFGDGKFILCPITGEMILRNESCVHHEPEFNVLVTTFLGTRNLSRADVAVETGDNITLARLADLTLEHAWQAYHRANARLIIMSIPGHKIVHTSRELLP